MKLMLTKLISVFHYDDFTGPGVEEISFVQIDPNVVSSGTEARARKDYHL